jgi:radical SAM protein with 4Fe4S-binding SPASM domain
VFDPSQELGEAFFFGDLGRDGVLSVNQDRRNLLLKRVRERRELCRGCFCYWHCAGDCPAKTLTVDGAGHRYLGARCRVNRAVTKEILARLIFESGGTWRGERGPQGQATTASG